MVDCSSHPRIDNRSWNRLVAALAAAAAGAEAAEEARLLREALALLALAPANLATRFARLPRRAGLEAMLASGAGESAAIALLPADAGFIVSRGGNGVHLASVIFDGLDGEVAAEGATLGLALVAALAGGLRNGAGHDGSVAEYDAAGHPALAALH